MDGAASMSKAGVEPMKSASVAAILAGWLALALAAGYAGIPGRLPPPVPQLVIACLTTGLVVSILRIDRLRDWFFALDPRVIVSLHLMRLVGFYFILLYLREELPYDFAIPAGIGDIAIAFFALILITTSRAENRSGLVSYGVWNFLGLIDILFVVSRAGRLALNDPMSMRAMLELPLSLLITWLVPLIIGTHILFAIWLYRRSKETGLR